MRVEELARQAGVSPRSVRHYDRAGLLTSRRLPNGYREFDDHVVNEVRTIKRLVESGLSIADILALRPCLNADGEFNGCAESRRVLAHHVERLTVSIRRNRQTLALLRERQRLMTSSPERREPK